MSNVLGCLAYGACVGGAVTCAASGRRCTLGRFSTLDLLQLERTDPTRSDFRPCRDTRLLIKATPTHSSALYVTSRRVSLCAESDRPITPQGDSVIVWSPCTYYLHSLGQCYSHLTLLAARMDYDRSKPRPQAPASAKGEGLVSTACACAEFSTRV